MSAEFPSNTPSSAPSEDHNAHVLKYEERKTEIDIKERRELKDSINVLRESYTDRLWRILREVPEVATGMERITQSERDEAYRKPQTETSFGWGIGNYDTFVGERTLADMADKAAVKSHFSETQRRIDVLRQRFLEEETSVKTALDKTKANP